MKQVICRANGKVLLPKLEVKAQQPSQYTVLPTASIFVALHTVKEIAKLIKFSPRSHLFSEKLAQSESTGIGMNSLHALIVVTSRKGLREIIR